MQRKRQWAGRQEGNQSRSTKAKHEEKREDGAGVQKDGEEGRSVGRQGFGGEAE